MSRRDTIIIAMLVNTGLLAFLFMLAVNTESDNDLSQSAIVQNAPEGNSRMEDSPEANEPIALVDKPARDEVDTFLQELASEEKSQNMIIDDEGYVTLQPEPAVPVKPASVQTNEASPAGEEARYVEVTVKRGDALEKIARSNGTTVDAIKKANNMTSNRLSVGQVLRVPVGKKATVDAEAAKPKITAANTPKEAPKKTPADSNVQYYTIKSGDNPWKIAKQFNIRFEDLLKMNNLDEERARNLKIGEKIRVK